MINWNLILNAYTTSYSYFLDPLNFFLEGKNYFGECIETTLDSQEKAVDIYYSISYNNTKRLNFSSEIYENIKIKENESGGFRLSLSSEIMTELFETTYNQEQIFAVLFAYWYGLDEKHIKIIKDQKYKNCSLRVLDYFIRFPNTKKYKKQETSFPCEFHVYIDENTAITATFENGLLISSDRSLKFAII